MLVPDIEPCFPFSGLPEVGIAEQIPPPGAAISGFCRPSRVGPRLLNEEMFPEVL